MTEAKTKNQEMVFDKVSFSIFLILVFLLPIFFIPFPSFNFLFGKAILIYLATGLLFIFWLLFKLKESAISIPKNSIFLIGFSVPAIYLVSTFFSGSVMNSLIGQGFEVGTLAFILTLFVLMFVTSSVVNNKTKIYYTLLSILVSFIILSIFQLLRLIIGEGILPFGLATNSNANLLGKWNELGIIYGLLSVASLWLIDVSKRDGKVKILSYITLVVSIFFLSLVNFTLSWVVVGLFSLLAAIFNLFSDDKFKKPITSLIVFVISVIFIFNVGGSAVFLGDKLNVADSEIRPSIQGTLDVAKAGLRGKDIVIGTGPNTFVKQWSNHKPLSVNNTVFWNTDFNTGFSFILSSLVNVGVIGFLAWLSFLVTLLYQGFRFMRAKADVLSSLVFVETTYFWVYILFYVPSNAVLGLTFIFTGMSLGILLQNKLLDFQIIDFKQTEKINFIYSIVIVALVLVSAVGVYAMGQKYVATIYGNKGLNVINQGGDFEKGETYLVQSVRLSNSDVFYRYLSDIKLIKLQEITTNQELSKEEVSSVFQKNLDDAIIFAQKAVEVNTINYQNWLSLGKVYEVIDSYGVEGAYQQAITSYINASNLSLRNPSIPFIAGLLEYRRENYDNALVTLEKAVMLKPNYSDAKYLLGLTYYELDRNDDAVLQFKDLVLLNPDNEEVKSILANLERGYRPFYGLGQVSEEESAIEDNDEVSSESVIEE